jgi:uncharacterized membrane protein YfcA
VDVGLFVLLLLLTGLAAGLVGSLTGLGGAVVVLPVLVLAFGLPFETAAAAGFTTILATSAASGSAYLRDRLCDLRIGMFLEIATVPGAIAGTVVMVTLVHAQLGAALLVALGVVLIGLVPGAIDRTRAPRAPRTPDRVAQRLDLTGTYHDEATNRDVPYAAERTAPALAWALGAGLVSGMFGIGGGVLKVQALERHLGLPMKVATATSNFMIGVTGAAGAGVLLEAGFLNPLVAGPVTVGTAIGALAGSRLLPSLRNRTVRWFFLPVLVALAIELILRGLSIG